LQFASVRSNVRGVANTWIELRVLREKDGQSLTQLAKTANVALGYLSDLENGKRPPNPRVIVKLAQALNVPKSMLEPRREPEVA
jgi:transcriptional regulator with XRE-family HTH domain